MRIAALVLIAAMGGAGAAYAIVGHAYFENARYLSGDHIVEGRLAVTGTRQESNLPVGLIVEPRSPAHGLFSMAEYIAVYAYSQTDTGVLGSSDTGYGVQAISRHGTALSISGDIEKAYSETNRLTVYDDQGNALGSFFFSFD